MDLLSQYEGNGIYVAWDRLDPDSTVTTYSIYRSTHIDGTYSLLDTVDFPEQEYIDQEEGYALSSYYKIVTDTGVSSQPMYGESLLLRASLAYEMDAFLRVPVYNEELLFVNEDRTKGHVASWGAWSLFPVAPRVQISRYVNDGAKDAYMILPQKGTTDLITQVDATGTTVKLYEELEWYPDYNGHIFFVDASGDAVSIDWYDNIVVDYSFRAFSYQELDDAIWLAAGKLVSRPGISKTNRATSYGVIGDLPRRWDHALVSGAAYILMRRLYQMLLQRERRLVFIDPDKGVNLSDILALMKEYKEEFDDAAENIQKESFPSVGVNVTPEYYLPGQRNRFFRWSFKGY